LKDIANNFQPRYLDSYNDFAGEFGGMNNQREAYSFIHSDRQIKKEPFAKAFLRVVGNKDVMLQRTQAKRAQIQDHTHPILSQIQHNLKP
jgi:hypothetical protein